MFGYQYKELSMWQTINEYDSKILHIRVDGRLHEIEVYEEDIPLLLEGIMRVYTDMQGKWLYLVKESEL